MELCFLFRRKNKLQIEEADQNNNINMETLGHSKKNKPRKIHRRSSKKKRNTMKLKSFRMRPNMQLTIALVCDNLEITESDFIRESISNQL